MKKLLYFLWLLVLVAGCQEDDSGTPDTPVDKLLISVDIPNDYYMENPNFDITGHLYLTDADGGLLEETALTNNMNHTLESDYDIDNNSYDATFLRKFEATAGDSYLLNTFIDVEPMTLSLSSAACPSNPNDEDPRITMLNVGSQISIIEPSPVNHGLSCTSANGGTCVLSVRLHNAPGNMYFSFRKVDETFKRYIWLENATGETNETVEYVEIPILTDFKTINYPPDNNYVSTEILGYKSDESCIRFGLTNEVLSGGGSSTQHYFPEDLFDGYVTNTNLRNDDARYVTSRISENIEENFTLPNLDFQIVNNDVENYEIQSSSVADYYTVYFFYQNLDDGIQVQWRIHGKVEDIMKFSLLNMSNVIFEGVELFSISDLNHVHTRLHKLEGISAYNDIVQTIIAPNSETANQVVHTEYIEKD